MDALLLLLLFFLTFVLLAGIGIGLPIYVYRFLVKKGKKKWATILAVTFLCLFIYCIYTSVFPNDGFYKDDFEQYTNLPFPGSGRIISKDASYPDIHGHYSADARIVLSAEDYRSLQNRIMIDSSFVTDSTIGEGSNYFDQIIEGTDTSGIKKIVRKEYLKLAFLKDGKTILLEKMFSKVK